MKNTGHSIREYVIGFVRSMFLFREMQDACRNTHIYSMQLSEIDFVLMLRIVCFDFTFS